MVLLSLKQAPDGWEALRGAGTSSLDARLSLSHSSAASGGGPVLIFVAAGDVDALAATRVVTRLLKADLTRFELHPVHGYAHLAQKFAALKGAVQPRAVLTVNCGAMVDLGRVLEMEDDGEEGDVRVFVMDCHRPYHLRNIRNKRVVLFDDLEVNALVNMPLDVNWEDEWGNVQDDDSESEEDDENDDSESDESEDEDEEEEEEEDHQPNATASDGQVVAEKPRSSKRKRKRRRRRDRDADDIADDDVVFDDEGSSGRGTDDDEEEGDGEEGSSSDEHKRVARAKRKRKRLRRNRKRYGREDPETLEKERLREYYSNATVAMSSACLSHSIAAVMRRSDIDTLWMAITGVTSQFNAAMISSELYDDARGYFHEQLKDPKLNGQKEEAEGSSRVQNVGYASSCNAMQIHRIAPNTELRLDLLRHWSLYESLLYSTYTATRLSAWRQTGRRRLLEMLATLGIPLKDSQQDWCYMKQKNKIALENHLSAAIRRFDLGEKLEYDSFVRSLPGHKGDISAADFAHAISALLEFDDRPQRDRHGDTSVTSMRKFWRGYDALDMRKSALLDVGLEMAISVQRLTAEIGGDVIERRKFVPSGPFRYVFLRDQQSKELLAHPLLLRRLALFLKKALSRQGAREKPFIILAPDPSRDLWIAVAATTSGQRNDFGHRFRKAAERNGSEVTYDGFDSAVCEIKDGQEIEFVRFLHDVMR